MGKKKVNLLEGAAALIKHCESNECEGCVFCGDSGCEVGTPCNWFFDIKEHEWRGKGC